MTTLKDIYILEPAIGGGEETPIEEKPNPPSNATAIVDTDGNVQFFWEHLNPDFKLVSFKMDVENVRIITSYTKDALYLIGARTIDGLDTPLDRDFAITLWAISATGVESDPYSVTVTPVVIEGSIGTGPGIGLQGATYVTGNYTILESDNNKVLVCTASVPDSEFIITFPTGLSNGFICYIVNSLEGSATGNRRSYFSIVGASGTTFLTRTHNNKIKAGESRLLVHISNGRYFVLGKNEFIYDYVDIIDDGVAFVNQFYNIASGNITINLPPNPVDGAFVGFRVGSAIDIKNNPVTLNGSGNTIEGATNYIFNKPDERIVFFFTGDDWIYTSRSYYVDPNALTEVPRMTSTTISSAYTIQETDYKKWIKANGTFVINVPSSMSVNFECIIQNIGTGIITISGITNAEGNKLTVRWRGCHIYYDGTAWTAVGALVA